MSDPIQAPTPAPASVAQYIDPNASHKIVVGAVGGSATVILVWLLKQFGGVDMPAEVAGALASLVSAAVATFAPTFGSPE